MKFIHLADLHLGKSLHGVSLLESGDQAHWVSAFLELARSHRPQAVLVAGDVYDRGAPAAGAVELLSSLLTGLTDLEIPVLLIPGNHDSAQRLSFGRELLARQKLHIAPPLRAPGKLSRVRLEDEFGPVDFWLMPYVFPALVGEALGRETLRDYDAAVRALLEAQELDPACRNVLLAHQNVTLGGLEGPRGGSESMVGGVGQVDYRAFDAFDYVALGHIHAGYALGRPEVRYAGSPLCYHFHETKQAPKGPLLVELGPKGTPLRTELLPLEPLHRLLSLEGSREQLEEGIRAAAPGTWFSLCLSDQRVSPELGDHLRRLCEQKEGQLLELLSSYRQEAKAGVLTARELREKTLPQLFGDFFALRNGGSPMSPEEAALVETAASLMQGAELRQEPEEALADRLLAQALKEAKV